MPESFFHLSAKEQEEALQVAASAFGRPTHLLEKDIWVVWALSILFTSPLGSHLAFKGGTALSKAYKTIRRFSEDVDLTYDIRALAPQLVRNAPDGLDAIPPSRSQEKKWSDEIRKELLPAWLRDSAHPIVQAGLAGLPAATSRVTDGCISLSMMLPTASKEWQHDLPIARAGSNGRPNLPFVRDDRSEQICARLPSESKLEFRSFASTVVPSK